MPRTAFLLALLLLALLPLPGDGLPPPVGRDDPEAVLDAIFQRWDSTRSPGCALGVETGDGTWLTRAWGMADLEGGLANTPATVFEAGSVSKQFTVAAVVLLELEGRLSLEDDIRSHFPELPDYGEPIRVHHLVHHTSGLRDWGSVAAISGWGRGERTHTHAHVLEIAARQGALNFPPGFEYSYSNTGFNLLAMLVERVTGESFADFSTRRIFEPLGLTHTQWRDDYTRLVPGRSSAYAPAPGGGYRIDRPIEHVHGNGGLLTTVEDLIRWDRALRAGSHGLGGAAFVEGMHRTGVLTSGRPIHYAGGLQIGEMAGLSEVAHTGSTAGYRAFLGRYPDEGLVVALLCNSGDVNPGGVGRRVARHFLGLEDEDPLLPLEGVRLDGSGLRGRAGLYRNERTGEPVHLEVVDGELRWDGGRPLVPLSEAEFRWTSRAGEPDRRLVFQENGAFRFVEDGWELDLHVPTLAAEPTSGELRAYQGSYRSDEAETAFHLRVEGDSLHLVRDPDTRIPLSPLYPDAFQAPGLGRILFHRDAEGGVVELSVQQPRVYDLRMPREERGG